MPHILHRVPLSVSPQRVFEALTEADQLKRWWTDEVEAKPEAGALARFRFEGGSVEFRLRISELEPNQRLLWTVEAPAPPEWDGTQISWQVEPSEAGTELHFAHKNWQSTEGSFASINYSWGYYLVSLASFLEQGEGFPHKNPG